MWLKACAHSTALTRLPGAEGGEQRDFLSSVLIGRVVFGKGRSSLCVQEALEEQKWKAGLAAPRHQEATTKVSEFQGHLEGRSDRSSNWPEGGVTKAKPGSLEDTGARSPHRKPTGAKAEESGLWHIEPEQTVGDFYMGKPWRYGESRKHKSRRQGLSRDAGPPCAHTEQVMLQNPTLVSVFLNTHLVVLFKSACFALKCSTKPF